MVQFLFRGESNMYNAILFIIAIIIGVIGTIITLLSILKMGLKDVLYERTALAFDTQELSILQQVYYARVGIVWVIISAAIQIVERLFSRMTWEWFCIIVAIAVLFCTVWWGVMFCIYKRNYAKLMDGIPEDTRRELCKRYKKWNN